ncbi:hypothetical protein [Pseudomonas laurentiana]
MRFLTTEEKKDLYGKGIWTGKPGWDEHAWPQVVQSTDGHWYGVKAGWKMNIHQDFKEGDTFSLLSSDCEWLARGPTGDWRNSLEGRPLDIQAKAKTSVEFLQAAIDVQAERGKQYDSPGGERSMGRTVQAFNAITGRDLTEAEGWLLLQVLKDVRQWQNPDKFHEDSALDGVAYSSLKAEALAAGGAT